MDSMKPPHSHAGSLRSSISVSKPPSLASSKLSTQKPKSRPPSPRIAEGRNQTVSLNPNTPSHGQSPNPYSTGKSPSVANSKSSRADRISQPDSLESEDEDDAFLADLRRSQRRAERRASPEPNLFEGSSTEVDILAKTFDFSDESTRQPSELGVAGAEGLEQSAGTVVENDVPDFGPSPSLTEDPDIPSIVSDDEYLRRLQEGEAVKNADKDPSQFAPSSLDDAPDDDVVDGGSSTASSIPMVDFSESPDRELFRESGEVEVEIEDSSDEEYDGVGEKGVDYNNVRLNLGMTAWLDAASFHHEYHEVHPLADLPKTCFLSNSDKVIDLVILYDPKKGGKERHRNKIYRKNFILKLQALGLEVETCLGSDGKQGFMKIHAPWEFLCRYAEMIGVTAPIGYIEQPKKPSFTTRIINCCKCCIIGGRDIFRRKAEIDRPIQACYYMRFERSRLRFFIGNQKPKTFFSAIQRIQMVNYVVQRITLKRLRRRWQTEVPGEESQKESLDENVSYHWLKEKGVIGDEFPLHDCDADEHFNDIPVEKQPYRRWLQDHWGSWSCCFRYQPLDQIRAYFGAQIGLYFAWLGFYTKWLLIPAIGSILCLLFGIRNILTNYQVHAFCSATANETILCRSCPSKACPFQRLSEYCTLSRFGGMFDNELTVVFAIIVSVWSVCFVEYWKRYQNLLDSRWETSYGADMQDQPRPQFLLHVTSKRVSPITMEEEPYVATREKLRRLVSSITIIACMILLLLGFLAATIMYRTVAAVIIANEDFLPSFPPSILASVTSAIANLIVIQFMSFIYPRVARMMTEQERPRTQEDFETSYTYKVVCFQYINFYGSLFYLAFIRGRFDAHPGQGSKLAGHCSPAGCLVDLSIQLIIIMTVKQIIQNFMEVLQPKIINLISRVRKRGEVKKSKWPRWENDSLLGGNKCPVAFGDYLEMMIQYGFITMFSPAFPLAAFFALINNILEIRIDASKYLLDERRINPQPVRCIGPWQDILEVTTRASVVVNAFIIAFTSQTIDNIYYDTLLKDSPTGPANYFDFQFSKLDLSKAGNSSNIPTEDYTTCYFRGMFDENGNQASYFYHLLLVRLAFVLIFEHSIFILQSIIQAAVPDVPEVVKTTHLREKYLVHQKFMQDEFGDDFEEKLEANAITLDDKVKTDSERPESHSELGIQTDQTDQSSPPRSTANFSPIPQKMPVRSRIMSKIRRKQIAPDSRPLPQVRVNSEVIDLPDFGTAQGKANGIADRKMSSAVSVASTLKKNRRKGKAARKKGHFLARMARRLC